MEAAERRKAHETHLALSEMRQMRGKEGMTSLDLQMVVVKGCKRWEVA